MAWPLKFELADNPHAEVIKNHQDTVHGDEAHVYTSGLLATLCKHSIQECSACSIRQQLRLYRSMTPHILAPSVSWLLLQVNTRNGMDFTCSLETISAVHALFLSLLH